MITGIWQMGFDNNKPYWNYIKLPIVAFYRIIVFDFIYANRKLTENINKTEKYCSSQPSIRLPVKPNTIDHESLAIQLKQI